MPTTTRQTDAVMMSRDPAIAGRAASVLQATGLVLDQRTARAVSELSEVLTESEAPVAVVAINGEGPALFHDLEPVVAAHPRTRFVALVDELSPEVLRAAMQAGMRQAVARDELDAQLSNVVSHLLHDTKPTGAGGRSCLVLSAAGGTGATTLAINLAAEKASDPAPCLLVDLDPASPAHASCLDLAPEYGVDDVLGYDGPIDSHLVRSTVTQYSDALHVLASAQPLADAGALTRDRALELLRAGREAYAHTVIDAPRLPAAIAESLSREVDHVLVVFQSNVKDLRLTRRLLNALQQAGVNAQKLTPIANRHPHRFQPLRPRELRRTLGGWTVHSLPNDYRHAMASLTAGVPIHQTAPRAPLRKAIRGLARTMERS